MLYNKHNQRLVYILIDFPSSSSCVHAHPFMYLGTRTTTHSGGQRTTAFRLKLVLSFDHVGPEDGTQVIRLAWWVSLLSEPSHLTLMVQKCTYKHLWSISMANGLWVVLSWEMPFGHWGSRMTGISRGWVLVSHQMENWTIHHRLEWAQCLGLWL